MPNSDPDFGSTAVGLPAADVRFESAEKNGSDKNFTTHTFPVRTPEEDRGDFLIQVRASTLKKCRRRLKGLADAGFPWAEVMLALSSLAIGATLGALPSDIPASYLRYKFFFFFLPPLAASSLVGFIFLRRLPATNGGATARDVLEDLPDPDRSI